VTTRVALAACAGAALLLYAPLAAGLGRQWLDDPDAAYGAVLAVVAAAMFVRRMPAVRALPVGGSYWGLGALAAGGVLYMTGTLAADLFLSRLSLPIVAAGAIWYIGGAAHLRALAGPLTLGAIAIPLPSALVTELTMPLQLLASRCAASLLWVSGLPVERDGNVLTIGSTAVEVAQACNGLRSLVTLLALAATCVVVRQLSWRRGALILAAVVPAALAGNGLRIALTAILATRVGEAATAGVVHELTGWATFALISTALLFGVRPGSDRGQTPVRPRSDPECGATQGGRK